MKYSRKIPSTQFISGISVAEWGRYVLPESLRKDKKGVYYASTLFSMQVSLSYLRFRNIKVGVINDFLSESGNVYKRSLHLLECTPTKFNPIPIDSFQSQMNLNEPLIIFGGCAVVLPEKSQEVENSLHRWVKNFSFLVLACDFYYPQFPRLWTIQNLIATQLFLKNRPY